jgi:hypothetical protein
MRDRSNACDRRWRKREELGLNQRAAERRQAAYYKLLDREAERDVLKRELAYLASGVEDDLTHLAETRKTVEASDLSPLSETGLGYIAGSLLFFPIGDRRP